MSRSIDDPRLKAGDAGTEVDAAAGSVSPPVTGGPVTEPGTVVIGGTTGAGVIAGGELAVA